MHKAQIAELILSLFTGRELAASTVGDWMEEIPARGTFWFWSSVLRTAFSFVWRDIAEAPFHLASLALCAVFIGSALSFILSSCDGIVMMTLFKIGRAVLPPRALNFSAIDRFLSGVFGTIILVTAVQFQIGGWIARHAPGRELTACVLCEMVCILAGIFSKHVVGDVLGQPYALLGWISVISGGIWVRHRQSVFAKVI